MQAVVTALALAGCGGDGDSPTSTQPGATTPAAPTGSAHAPASGSTEAKKKSGDRRKPAAARGPERRGGRAPSVFIEAARVCAVGPAAKVAQNLGIKSTDPRRIARALAKGYKPRFRSAAYRGCLTALG